MQMTLRLDDDLYRQARARAAALGISLTGFFEEAIRQQLTAPVPARWRQIRLPVSSASGGLADEFSTLEEARAATDLAADLRRLE
jgi:plasmid stability protein